MFAKSSSLSCSALAFRGTEEFSRIALTSAFGKESPDAREFESVFLRCEKAAFTTLKNFFSSSSYTAGSLRMLSLKTAESTFGAGINEPALTENSISGSA